MSDTCTHSTSGIVRKLLTNIFKAGYTPAIEWESEEPTRFSTHTEAVKELLHTHGEHTWLAADEGFLHVYDKAGQHLGYVFLVETGSDSACELIADYTLGVVEDLIPESCAYCA